METRIRISIQKIKKKKKKQIACTPPPLFCSFARPMQIRRENRGRGREDRSTCHRMSTHDRSRVGRGINMKSCRLIYDPGTGRPLLDLWRYPLFPPPSLPPGKRRLYFLSARDGAESSVNFLFFKTFSLKFCELQFREIYTVRKRQSLFDFFYTLCRDDRRDWQDFKISRASRNIYRFQLVAEKRKKFNGA